MQSVWTLRRETRRTFERNGRIANLSTTIFTFARTNIDQHECARLPAEQIFLGCSSFATRGQNFVLSSRRKTLLPKEHSCSLYFFRTFLKALVQALKGSQFPFAKPKIEIGSTNPKHNPFAHCYNDTL